MDSLGKLTWSEALGSAVKLATELATDQALLPP